MASTNIFPTLDRKPSSSDNSGGEEKQIGTVTSIDAPVPLEAAHAVKYVEFLQLKNHFESDSKAYKALVRRRLFPRLSKISAES
jgi:hypothetical protein